MKKFLTFFVLGLLLVGCGEFSVGKSDGLKVLTTIAPLYSLTLNLVEGTDTAVNNLLEPNVSVHSFQLTPKVAIELEEADFIVMNGLDLEHFLEGVIEESDSRVLVASDGVELLSLVENVLEDEVDHGDDHGHGEFDPHVWLSPVNAKIMAENIFDELVVLDPDNLEIYESNLELLIQELDELDGELESGFSDMDLGVYIVFHDAYQYFEQRYGVSAVAYLEEFPGKQPSTDYLARVVDLIETENVKVLFSEPQFSPKLVDAFALDYDLEVGELDPMGKELSKDGYFVMMRKNLESFKRAFGQ